MISHYQINDLQYLICTGGVKLCSHDKNMFDANAFSALWVFCSELPDQHSLNLISLCYISFTGFQTMTLLFLVKAKCKKLSLLYSPWNSGWQSSAEKRFWYLFSSIWLKRKHKYLLQRLLTIWVSRVGWCSYYPLNYFYRSQEAATRCSKKYLFYICTKNKSKTEVKF